MYFCDTGGALMVDGSIEVLIRMILWTRERVYHANRLSRCCQHATIISVNPSLTTCSLKPESWKYQRQNKYRNKPASLINSLLSQKAAQWDASCCTLTVTILDHQSNAFNGALLRKCGYYGNTFQSSDQKHQHQLWAVSADVPADGQAKDRGKVLMRNEHW